MRLTRFGFKALAFYLAMVGAFYASPYSNLFFLLLAFLTAQWVFGALWTAWNLRGLTAVLSGLEPVPAGVPLVARARVEAPGRVRFQVAVELELQDGTRALGELGAVERAGQLVLRGPALPRGIHRVRGARVSTSYPLGLFAARRAVDAPGELVVYPAPTELAGTKNGARTGAEALAEVLGANSGGAGDLQPAGLRDHREGDEVRAVHWRATARRGSLVVKEWEGGGGEGLEVLLDRRASPEALEDALSLLSALVELARENKEALVLHSQGLQATFGDGHRPWSEALRFLAGAEPLPADGPAPPPVSPAVTRLPFSREGVVAHAG